MGENSKSVSAPPPCYAVMYPMLAEIAKRHGYALAVHGSMRRDFDLLAVPWTEEASDPEPMLLEMKAAAEGVWTHHDWDHIGTTFEQGSQKPHGRRAYSIHLTNTGCNGPYLDISVMPRSEERDAEMREAWKLVNAMAGQEFWDRAELWLKKNERFKPAGTEPLP